jgi:hypothetical protein
MSKNKYYALNIKEDTKERAKELQEQLGGVESQETEDGLVRHLIKETYGMEDDEDG